MADCSEAIKLDPKLSTSYVNQGQAYFLLRELKNAADDFTKALAIDPQDGTAYQLRGQARLLMGDSKAAQDDFTMALKYKQKGDQVRYTLQFPTSKYSAHPSGAKDSGKRQP